MTELFNESPSYPPDELTDAELFDDLEPPRAKILRFPDTEEKICIHDEGDK